MCLVGGMGRIGESETRADPMARSSHVCLKYINLTVSRCSRRAVVTHDICVGGDLPTYHEVEAEVDVAYSSLHQAEDPSRPN